MGLSNDKGNNVHCSIEDQAGNLWFGTTGDGLFKYDPSASLRTGGKTFTQFTTSNGLNHNSVNHILEDKAGNIWIGTEAGLMLYDPSAAVRAGGKTFTEIKIPFRKNVPSQRNDVWSIMQDKSGKLWFATFDGVYNYDPSSNLELDGKSFNFFKVTDDTSDCIFKMEYILEDKAGSIWFGGRCNKGVHRYDPTASPSGCKTISHIKPFGDDWLWPVLQDKNGDIWFSNWKGAYRYDSSASLRTGSELFEKVEGLFDGPITRIIEDRKGNLWFGGGGRGLCRYNPDRRSESAPLSAGGKTFTCFTAKDGLINDDVWSILEDRKGLLWVGTRQTILHRFDGKTFTNFTE